MTLAAVVVTARSTSETPAASATVSPNAETRTGHVLEVMLRILAQTSQEETVDDAMRTFLKGIREQLKAQYGAVTVYNLNGELTNFLHMGFTEEQLRRMTRQPEGRGLLGYILKEQKFLRLDDMSKHPNSTGFPSEHPAMKSLLAGPITHKGRSLGSIYLSERTDGKPFSEEDESFLRVACTVAAVFINEKYAIRDKQLMQEEASALAGIIDRLSQGDFAVEVDPHAENETISLIRRKTSQMASNLRKLIRELIQVAQTLTDTSHQISTTAENLAHGAQQQSMQAEDVSAAVEEMAQTIADNANNTSMTSDMAQNNGQVAQEGGHVVHQTVEAIRKIVNMVNESAATVERLGDSSRQIGEIVSVIDEIADQTNMLALNAAIEAARAGEHGKGFAVVADEVRKLAERTSNSTQEISRMIKTVQTETQQAVNAMRRGSTEAAQGNEYAEQASSALEKILIETQKVVDMITQIATATEEQSATSTVIAQNVETMAVRRRNPRRVSPARRVERDLQELTDQLGTIVSRFNIGDRHTTTASAEVHAHA
ncbi:MAG: methyl-accepting chemotaxis protein [Rhodothermales bacterium]